ncbi:MAG TPA: GxxExxY protein [Acidobacteriota bacterium]|jgi:GxxExxY protein|nr:GxxExxY protein [Acidobacteriota bacterium]
MDVEDTAQQIVDAAIKVHRSLGPGLLESAYQACLKHELTSRGLRVDCQLPIALQYDGSPVDVGYRLDLLVEGVMIEVKAVETLLPIHRAQLLTYMKLAGHSLGFLINFNVCNLRDGLKRVVLNHPSGPRRFYRRKPDNIQK